MPPKNYAKHDATLDGISGYMVTDLQTVFTSGITVTCHDTRYAVFDSFQSVQFVVSSLRFVESAFTCCLRRAEGRHGPIPKRP